MFVLFGKRVSKPFWTLLTKDVRPFHDATAASIRKMSGNGMHLPSAGFTALVAMVCVIPKAWWEGWKKNKWDEGGKNMQWGYFGVDKWEIPKFLWKILWTWMLCYLNS